jgi:Fe-S-cluster-containing dehydrogenase component
LSGSFVFDTSKCTGCGACRVACTIENGLAPDVSWRRIETFNPQHRAIAPVFHLSLACNHCATAACMNACPALAYRRDEPTGAVLLDSGLCIGCGYCSWACPYDAPVYDEAAGVMTKCTWCAGRLRAGLKPSCAVHCPTGALDYRDVDPASRVTTMPGLPRTSLEPSLHVIPVVAAVPAMTAPSFERADPSGIVDTAGAQPNISLVREWPLAVFTLGAALLVALVAAAAAGAVSISALPFIISSGAVMGVAGLHLGRKGRAWRAILNVRRSWLSREIVVMSGFVALSAVWLLILPDSRVLGVMTALAGFAGLFCADSVYGILPGGPGYRHSAGVMATGLLAAAVMTGNLPLAVPIVALKAWMFWNEDRRLPPFLTVARVAAGFAGPLLFVGVAGNRPAALACVVAGEAIGRCEYYVQLTRRTPSDEMDRALAGLRLEDVRAR